MTDQVEQSKTTLGTPSQYLKGVGPARAELLERLDLRMAGDLLFFFPRGYEHPAERARIADLREDEPASLVGTITEIDLRSTQAGKSILGILVEDDSGTVRLMFFNQPYRVDQLSRDMRVLVSGKPRVSGLRMEMVHPKVVPLADEEAPGDGEILPIYSLTEGINQGQMRRIVRGVVDELSLDIKDVIPETVRKELDLCSVSEATTRDSCSSG